MLILRIRQAETALKDARLDEAFELARAEDVRAHRRGQNLIGRLARALAERGQAHLSAGRLAQASADGEKANCLGGNLPEVASLRLAIANAASQQQQADRRRADALAAAREHIDNGQLTIGQHLLADAPGDDARANLLGQRAAARRAAGEAALGRAQSALGRGDWAGAIDAGLEAKQAHPSSQEVIEIMNRTRDLVVQETALAIDKGRLDLAESMLRRVEPLAGGGLQLQELSRCVAQCRSCVTFLDQGRPREAVEGLRRLCAVRPSAGWLAEACRQAEQAAESLERLRSGPLGLVPARDGQAVPVMRQDDTISIAPVPVPALPRDAGAGEYGAIGTMPARFMIHVDGVGSFLVLRDRRITVGPASSSRRPDVELLAEAGLPMMTIERTDEDYFLSSDVPVRVNGSPVTRKLLSPGDRIALGPRCRIVFTRPNAASNSAVVQLSGTRLPSGDARRIILLDESIILGPGPTAHIRADDLPEPAVLYTRGGRLFARSKTEVTVNDRPMDRNVGIPIGANVRIGPISLAITETQSTA